MIYLKSWFLIDFISIIPFDMIGELSVSSTVDYHDPEQKMNQFVRLTKVSKLYKLIKFTRMIRLLKIVKKRKEIMRRMKNVMQFGATVERLSFFVMMLLLMCHFAGCFWIFIAKNFHDEEVKGDSWVEDGHSGSDMAELYVVSLYFTMQTVTTVGYGDIGVVSSGEKIICISLQLVGIITFSFFAGALTNIIQEFDTSNAANQEKINTLNRLYKVHDFRSDLYYQLLNQIQNVDDKKVFKETQQFLEDLPFRMKTSLIMFMYKA